MHCIEMKAGIALKSAYDLENAEHFRECILALPQALQHVH